MPAEAERVSRITGITGRTFLKALTDAGVIQPGDYVRRVVIDAHVDAPVFVYVERIGDTRLLDVVTTLDGVEIRENMVVDVLEGRSDG